MPPNATALRSDIPTAFDDRKFVIPSQRSEWAVRFLGPNTDLGRLYHITAVSLDPNRVH